MTNANRRHIHWTTLCVVRCIDSDDILFQLQGWGQSRLFRVPFADLPEHLRGYAVPGARFQAQVNVGEPSIKHIFAYDWRLIPDGPATVHPAKN